MYTCMYVYIYVYVCVLFTLRVLNSAFELKKKNITKQDDDENCTLQY